jgi:hypothetical protein
LAVSGTARPNAYFTVPGDGKEIVCGLGAGGTLAVVVGRVGDGVDAVAVLELGATLADELPDPPPPDVRAVVGVDEEPLASVVAPAVVGAPVPAVPTTLDGVDPSVTTARSDVPGPDVAFVTSVLPPSALSSVSPDPLHALRSVAPPIATASSQRGVAIHRPARRATASSRCQPTTETSLERSPSASRMSVQA